MLALKNNNDNNNKTEKTFATINSAPEVFLEKSVLKICNKFTGEYLS